MKAARKIWNSLLFDTYGNIALAGFIISVISGVFLAVPFNVAAAYDSVSLMLITNLPAIVFRNLHYWSAQFFLIFTLLHTLEHMRLSSAAGLSRGIWFRLVLSLLFVFYVMLSGFILKGDADSVQALRILKSLVLKIPLSGQFLAAALLGDGDQLQLIYVHHIAMATLVIIFIIFEHTRTLLTRRSTFIIVLALSTVLSFFVHAPLHNNLYPVLKGPWYFIGMQEIMHWTSRPGWIWLLVLSVLALIFVTYYSREKTNRILYRLFILLSLIYFMITLTGYFFRGENWAWETPWNKTASLQLNFPDFGFRKTDNRYQSLTAADIPVVRGMREACMVCHEAVTGFSPAHDPRAIGCTSCHLGNPFTLDKANAHRQMVLIPGNIDRAKITCGTIDCHPAIADRIHFSMMTTNSGLVSLDRLVFGQVFTPDNYFHIQHLEYSPADKHLRDLCANCHLGNEKKETGPVDQLTRGGGCTACHLNYQETGLQEHFNYLAENKSENHLPHIHPSLDLSVTDDHCFGCHSRSGRISTNFEGWHETLLDAEDVEDSAGYRVLQDKRVFRYVGADVHHTAGMECIDCHTSYGVMGDGKHYFHEEDAIKISCEDCHFENPGRLVSYDKLDIESRKIFDLRKFNHGDKNMIRTAKDEIPLVNVFVEGDQSYMISKRSGKKHTLNSPGKGCTGAFGHQTLSCSSCHSSWAPTCIGCHNEFDPQAEGYDLLEGRRVKGEWVEYVGEFFTDLPTLGVREGSERKIEPAIPGMILTIDTDSYTKEEEEPSGKQIFHRLYAPAAPHTTIKKGRGCASCHSNPLALGYGRGKLKYTVAEGRGKWEFTPDFAKSKYDGLPEDAWIRFPEDFNKEPIIVPGVFQSTRSDFRPFSHEEQKRILTVGVCLSCHPQDSDIMLESLTMEFKFYLSKISDSCIMPGW